MIFFNPHRTGDAPAEYARARASELRALFAHNPLYAATPLVALPDIAARLGIGALYAKDERARLAQGSFKSLGGAYAVVQLVAHATRQSAADIFSRAAKPAPHLTFATATAGNHGRAVALGARMAGARAVIFVYGDVPREKRDAIAALGGELVDVPGDYEAACAEAERASAANGWTMVSDVASPGYTQIPGLIMQGYAVLSLEAVEQVMELSPPAPPYISEPTHIYVQAGVGGLAAATAGFFAGEVPAAAITVVEAATVPCLMESVRAGAFTRTAPTGATNLARMDCPTPSSTAWPVLRDTASAFVVVDNDIAAEAAAMLADAGLATTPTGAAGLAGLLAMARAASAQAGLSAASRVLIVITEA